MSDKFSIIGCGARTPLGFDRPSTAVAVRAGISSFAEHPTYLDRFGEPMIVALDAELDPNLALPDRLMALAVPAAHEALAPLNGISRKMKTATVISLGEKRPDLDSKRARTFAKAFQESLPDSFQNEKVIHQMSGHAGGIWAIEEACTMLSKKTADVVLAGGVDSYISLDTLEWLDDNETLHSEENIYGFCPGEGAGFVLACRTETAQRFGLTPLATLVSVGSGVEKNLINTENICLGEGLSSAFLKAAKPLRESEPIDRIICDLNGERYRGAEYGFAVLTTSKLFKDAAAFEAPADCWGDVGAASGPLFVNLVVEAEAHGYAAGPLSLIWASSEGGRRAAAVLRRWEHTDAH